MKGNLARRFYFSQFFKLLLINSMNTGISLEINQIVILNTLFQKMIFQFHF